MATADIYRAQAKIDSCEFHKEFLIIEADHNEIIWSFDGEPTPRKGRIESILIWVKAGMRPPEIHFIPPEWELTIDGETIFGEDNADSSLRFNIPVKGTVAELRYGDLRFVFRFSD